MNNVAGPSFQSNSYHASGNGRSQLPNSAGGPSNSGSPFPTNLNNRSSVQSSRTAVQPLSAQSSSGNSVGQTGGNPGASLGNQSTPSSHYAKRRGGSHGSLGLLGTDGRPKYPGEDGKWDWPWPEGYPLTGLSQPWNGGNGWPGPSGGYRKLGRHERVGPPRPCCGISDLWWLLITGCAQCVCAGLLLVLLVLDALIYYMHDGGDPKARKHVFLAAVRPIELGQYPAGYPVINNPCGYALQVLLSLALWIWWIIGFVRAWRPEAAFCIHLSPGVIWATRIYILLMLLLALLCLVKLLRLTGPCADRDGTHRATPEHERSAGLTTATQRLKVPGSYVTDQTGISQLVPNEPASQNQAQGTGRLPAKGPLFRAQMRQIAQIDPRCYRGR